MRTPHRRPALAGSLVLLIAGLMVISAAGPASAVDRDWRDRMLSRINAVRAEANVPPVSWCPDLGRAARSYAATMARTNHFGHVGPDGSQLPGRVVARGYRGSIVGETLAAGQGTVYQAMQAWRGSPSHLATITNPSFRHVGLGFAYVPGSTYGTYWVQDFGAGGRC